MLKKFIRDDSAATAIEYGLIAVIVSLAAVASLGGISNFIETSYSDTAAKVQEASSLHR